MLTHLIGLFLLSLLPALLWVWFFYRRDRFEREPVWLLARLFIAGMVAVLPAAAYEYPFRQLLFHPSDFVARALLAFLVVGLGEEAAKLLAVYVAVYRSPGRQEFNEVLDGIIYAVTAALGFAAVENLLYTLAFGLGVAPVRAVAASLAHASFSGVMGYYLGLARIRGAPGARSRLVGRGLLTAASLHAGYDLLITTGALSPLFTFLLVYGLYRYLSGRIRDAQALSPFREE